MHNFFPTRKPGVRFGRQLALAVLLSAGAVSVTSLPGPVLAQSLAISFEIPAGPLGTAINRLGERAGLQIIYPADLVRGKRSNGVSGSYSAAEALTILLGSSGLSFEFTGRNSVTLLSAGDSSEAAYGATHLGTIVLGGRNTGRWDGSADSIYETAANVDAISRETLENWQITSPSDVLRGTTGVLSGDSRNSGSLSPNIRGLQGMGRVPVSVDGVENSSAAYRGYQGVADRSYIDPDFISSIAVEKGANVARAGVGGAVSMTTVTADDILREGQRSGFALKFSASGNTSDPQRGTTPGGGSERPSLLKPTGYSSSLTWAGRGEWVDVVLGASKRDQGNYHAGSDGQTEGWVYTQFGTKKWGPYSGILHDDEVLNTSAETHSGLAKVTFSFSDDLKWQLAASHYRSSFGEIMPSRYTTVGFASQWRLSEIRKNDLTSRLRWDPEGNDLIDLSWNIWHSAMESTSAPIFDTNDIQPHSTDHAFGMDLSNTMRFASLWGDVSWTLGTSYKHEDSVSLTNDPEGTLREGARIEKAVFTRAEWAPTDWLSLNGGLRYAQSVSVPKGRFSGRETEHNSLDRSVGLSVIPFEGLQLYTNYSDASRLPSLFEIVLQGINPTSPGMDPERAKTLDLGVNYQKADLFGGDQLGLKLSYFDMEIDGYLARIFGRAGDGRAALLFSNLDLARFKGFDFSATYERGGFAAKFGATYYDDVLFCDDGKCGGNTTNSDYAKNHMPPKFQLSLDLSQKLLEDSLTLGARATRYSGRATDAMDGVNGSLFVAPVGWHAATLVDLYAHYQLTSDARVSFDIQNVTDQYYIEPLSLAPVPGPGRTVRVMMDYRF